MSLVPEARAAKDAGVGTVLIKSHQTPTVERAWQVAQCVPGIRVYGGVVLNETVGRTGFSVDHIRTMMQTNPERLLDGSQPICQKP